MTPVVEAPVDLAPASDRRARWQSAVMAGVARIFREALTCETEEALGQACLTVAEEVTGSRFGFIGEFNQETGHLDDIAISDPGWEACRMESPSGHAGRLPVGFKVRGLYGRVLLDDRTVVCNDPASHPDRVGTPPGHPALTAFLGVPLRLAGKATGLIGLGNREGGYGPEEQEAAEALAPAISQAFLSKRAEAALRRSEQRAAARAAELQAVLDTVPAAVWIAQDQQCTRIDANRFGAELLRRPPGSNVSVSGPPGERLADVTILKDGRPLAPEELPIQLASRGTEVRDFEFDVVFGDGTVRHLLGNGAPLLDHQGRPRGSVGAFIDITGRKETEQRLREEEAKYRLLFENLTEEVRFWEVERDEAGLVRTWRLLDANPPALRAWGRTSVAELRGKTADEVSPGSASRYVDSVRRAMAEKVPVTQEDHFPELGRYVRSTFIPIGERFISTGSDVTELAQRASTAQSRLAAIIESTHDAIIGKDLDGVIRSWNSGAERIYGWSAAEMVGRTVDVLAPADRAGETRRLMERIRRGEEAVSLDTVRLGKGGARIEVSLTLSPIRDQAGRVVGVSTIARDVGERKRAEEQVLAASLYARSLIEASLDPLVTISPEGKITDVNRATEEATGVPRSRIIGTDFADYFTEPEKARAGYRQVLAAGRVRDYPLTIRHIDGRTTEVLYNATVYRSRDGALQGVFAAARDVTERRNAERERSRMEEQLRQSQKLEAVGRLAGGVAHDFNNLLTAIIGASDFLLEELPETASTRQEAADIREAARKAAALTRQLLTFSRKQMVQPRVLDLDEVVATMDRMLRRLIGENIELVAVREPSLGRVLADPGRSSR